MVERLWKHIGRVADAQSLGSALLGFAGVGAIMTWAASTFDSIAAHGWGAVVIAGTLLACVIAIAISLLMIAWRYLRPLSFNPPQKRRSDSKNEDSEPLIDGGDRQLPAADAPNPSGLNALYIGHILLSEVVTLDDLYLELTFRIFNPNQSRVSLYASGVLEVSDTRDPSFALQFPRMPTPSVRNGPKIEISKNTEGTLVLWQQFKNTEAAAIKERYWNGSNLQLSLRKLNIVAEGNGSSAVVPLWSAVGFQKPPEKMPWISRAIDLNITVGTGSIHLS